MGGGRRGRKSGKSGEGCGRGGRRRGSSLNLLECSWGERERTKRCGLLTPNGLPVGILWVNPCNLQNFPEKSPLHPFSNTSPFPGLRLEFR